MRRGECCLDLDVTAEMWLCRDYLPDASRAPGADPAGARRLQRRLLHRALEPAGRDLASGEWDSRYGHLRTQPTLDIGLRPVIAELR